MKPDLGIRDEGRRGVVALLGDLLADEYVLDPRARDYPRNVVGPRLAPLHALFGARYEQLDDIVDDEAERIRQLGDRRDHEAVIRTLRSDLRACGEQHGDVGTEDFLTGLMERHEKMAWMPRAHLEGAAG